MESQCSRLLRMLKKSKYGIANYEFPKAGILRYSARIGDLRKEGHNIYCERVYANGRWTGVFKYYLIEDADNKPTGWINRLRRKHEV